MIQCLEKQTRNAVVFLSFLRKNQEKAKKDLEKWMTP